MNGGGKVGAAVRKRSKWRFCGRHAGWFAGERRARVAETFVEGGPGMTVRGCAEGVCRLWPGTDFYTVSFVTEAGGMGEAALDWTGGSA